MRNPRQSLTVHSLIRDRWSPRAFDGSAIDLPTLEAVLEGARWAPSAFNAQPWRFIYALRDDAYWESLLDLLVRPIRPGPRAHRRCCLSRRNARR